MDKKEILDQKEKIVQKVLGTKTMWPKKNCMKKVFNPNKCWYKQIFWSKTYLGQKSKKKMGTNKILVQKIFGSKKILLKKKLIHKN